MASAAWRTRNNTSGGRNGLRKRPVRWDAELGSHLPAGEELALLVGRWGIESPRCEVLAQLLKISAVVTWRMNILVEENAVTGASMQAFKNTGGICLQKQHQGPDATRLFW